MATRRQHPTDFSGKLRLAASSLTTVDEGVESLMEGVSALPISEAAAKVKKAGRVAAKQAGGVIQAEEEPEAAAVIAAKGVATADAAKASAERSAHEAAAAARAAQAAAGAAMKLSVARDQMYVLQRCLG